MSEKNNQTTDLLLQVNPEEEESKFGFNELSILETINELKGLNHVNLKGLMAMAPHTEDREIIKKTFKKTRSIYDKIRNDDFPIEYLSMGMSNDYKIAIDEGSNMIRIGSIIFK